MFLKNSSERIKYNKDFSRISLVIKKKIKKFQIRVMNN